MAKKDLKVGDTAPGFSLPDDGGKLVKLSDFKGKKVILFFYPKDSTPGCTQEACDFTEALPKFNSKKAVVLGVSRDSVASHAKFRDKFDLGVTLLSDEKGEVCEAYGVWKEKSLYGRNYMGIERTTFLIGPTGKILSIFPKVKVNGHILEVLKSLS